MHSYITDTCNSVFIPVTSFSSLNPLNAQLNPIRHLLALLGAHHILHVSRIKGSSKIWYLKIVKYAAWFLVSLHWSVHLFQNTLLRKTFGRTWVDVQGNGENYIARSLVIWISHQILIGRSKRGGWGGVKSGTYRGTGEKEKPLGRPGRRWEKYIKRVIKNNFGLRAFRWEFWEKCSQVESSPYDSISGAPRARPIWPPAIYFSVRILQGRGL